MEKLYVELICTPHQSYLKEGDKGFIHAYVQGADSVPYAVVVTEQKIDMIPISALRPQQKTTNIVK